MNTLDYQIKKLFINLVNSNNKYLTKIDYNNSEIVYNINRHVVKLRGGRSFINEKEQPENKFSDFEKLSGWRMRMAHSLGLEWEVVKGSKTTETFQLIIDGKNYTVIGLSRSELANALDLLDNTLSDYESETLQDITRILDLENEVF